MSFPHSFLRRWWLLGPLCAGLFIFGSDFNRVRQVQRITAIGRETTAGNPGRADRHWLVVPEHNSRSYQWLAETEQMLTRGEGRVRRVGYENAPAGREVHSASPFRWWLGFVTRSVEKLSGQSGEAALETAALWAGPLLQLLVLAVGTLFVARRFGGQAAALFSVGLAALFPLAGEFLPGVPDDHGLVIVCAGASVLLVVDGLRSGQRRSFIFSGVAGGLGLWIGVATEVPVLISIGVGALLLATWEKFRRSTATRPPLPWNSWALAGALTSLAAYFAEYFPAHLDMRLQANHPLYGVAWIGLGLLLSLAESWRAGETRANARTITTLAIALSALAALPATMALTNSPAFLVANPQASRVTNLPNGGVAGNLALWLKQDGQTLAVLATCLPFLLLIPVAHSLFRRKGGPAHEATVIVAGSVVLVGAATACAQLQGWTMAQLALLVLLLSAASLQIFRSWLIVAVCLLPGIVHLAGTIRVGDAAPLTRLEAEGLVERDLAHWIADHADAGGAVVLAAPERTPGLWFHGRLRGLGSPNWENREGVAAAVNILGATTADEAQALLERRGVTHILLPSWDTEMDEFVKWTKHNPADTFLAALHRWALPPWLEPLPYHLPEIAGFEGQSVLVLKVTGDTDRALSLSRLAEYALEMQDAALTSAVNDSLQTFPANLVALLGRAQIEKARGNATAFDQVLATIRQNLTNGLDRTLPWDRRLSLAIVLAQGTHTELARPQLKRCMAGLTEARIRALGAGSLYRLLVLSKALEVPITEPKLRELALTLLPADARARL